MPAFRPLASYMADSKISYQDAGLDYQQAAKCEAYTIIGSDALSMLAVDDSGVVTAAVYYPFNNAWTDASTPALRAVLASDDVFRLRFRNHFCAIFHPRFTLVPSRLFNPANLHPYFSLLLSENNMIYGYNRLPDMDCVAVYAHKEEEQHISMQLSGRDSAPHLAAAFLRAAQFAAPVQGHSLIVNVRNRSAQVAVFDRQHLLYYNVTPNDGPADLVYYIMVLFDQFRLSQQTTPVFLAGNIHAQEESVGLLRNFIERVAFIPAQEKHHFPALSNPIPEHFFFELISLRHFGR